MNWAIFNNEQFKRFDSHPRYNKASDDSLGLFYLECFLEVQQVLLGRIPK